MPAALTITKGTSPLTDTTVSGTGFAATTSYDVVILRSSGFTTVRTVTTDGAGAFSTTFIPQGRGTYTVNAYLTTAVSAANTSAYIHSDN